MIHCENLTVTRGENIIFSGLGFSLMPGSLLCLKGANGSGKTTLLKTLAGLLSPKEGVIEREGIVHYIGHHNAIKPRLTVRENLAFYAELYQTPELIMAGINYFELQEVMDVPCFKLSAGWQKRVALARLAACYADIWLLDEPEAHLDTKGKEILFNLIYVRVNQGGTVILSSHNALPFTSLPELIIEDFKEAAPLAITV